eukprot:Gb_34607 [translate_table: standard]
MAQVRSSNSVAVHAFIIEWDTFCNSVTRDVAYSSRPLRWVAVGGDGRLLPASSRQTLESPQILRFHSILLSTVKLSTSAKCGPSPNNNISASFHQSEPLFFSFKHFLMEVAQYQNIQRYQLQKNSE